jgi:hypothetical protein
MSSWEQIKEIKGLLTALVGGFVIVSAVGLALMDWRIGVHVRSELAKQDLMTDANIVAINSSVAENTRTGEENAEDIAENKQAVRDAFIVLMGGSNANEP